MWADFQWSSINTPFGFTIILKHFMTTCRVSSTALIGKCACMYTEPRCKFSALMSECNWPWKNRLKWMNDCLSSNYSGYSPMAGGLAYEHKRAAVWEPVIRPEHSHTISCEAGTNSCASGYTVVARQPFCVLLYGGCFQTHHAFLLHDNMWSCARCRPPADHAWCIHKTDQPALEHSKLVAIYITRHTQ